MKKRREVIKLEPFDYSRLTSEQGHDYGKGRQARVFKHKNERRQKDRLRRELGSY